MTTILGIDPGPLSCGWAIYSNGKVVNSGGMSMDAVIVMMDSFPGFGVAIERVQAQSKVGNEIMWTCEVSSHLYQAALDRGHEVHWIYRREVLAALNASGKGTMDSLVRARLMEAHGGATAKGTKKAPGPLYGVSTHAWAALAVAWVAMQRIEKATTGGEK